MNPSDTISQLLIDYCFALDCREFTRLATDIFASNASFGGTGADWHGAQQIADRIEAIFEGFEGTAHFLSNLHITVDGDHAQNVAYLTAWHWLKQSPSGAVGRPADWVLVAAYHDKHIQTPSGWRIAQRKVKSIAPSNLGIGEIPKLLQLTGHPR